MEIELVLPHGMGRLDLAERLARAAGGTVEVYETVSKVPVPEGLPPAATIALITDIARHHQGTVRGVSPDYRHFYVGHRAARLVGAPIGLTIVHDNTLVGGERVAELVTSPLWRADLDALAALLAEVAAIEGVTLPETAALHVHLDGARFCSAAALSALVVVYREREAELPRLTGMPAGLRRAAPLPPALIDALSPDQTWAEVEALLRQHVQHRGYALNLYNLAAGEPHKLTVEFKLAGATVDGGRVRALRELFVSLGLEALRRAGA